MTDTQTGAALLRNILIDPADDAARLVYADWLTENGEPGRAEYVRWQVGIVQGGGNCVSHVGSESPTRRLYRPWMLAELDALPLTDPWEAEYRRGFIEVLHCTCAEFVAHAADLFACQPITGVRLVDKAAAETDGKWGLYRSPQKPNAYQALAGHVLPSDVWELLERAPDTTFRSWKFFESRELASGALSAACVRLGRRRAGLPADAAAA